VSVHDGDTITILDDSKGQHKIRLSGIDAPELGQPFGDASRQNLARYVFEREVVAQCPKRDRFGRSVCLVRVNGEDVNLAQLRDGMAWHFKRYQDEQPLEEREAYGQMEEWARAQRNGLWRDKQRIPPWDWRRATKGRPS
jgi:endonuclease YncB( thermonuclease family)